MPYTSFGDLELAPLDYDEGPSDYGPPGFMGLDRVEHRAFTNLPPIAANILAYEDWSDPETLRVVKKVLASPDPYRAFVGEAVEAFMDGLYPDDSPGLGKKKKHGLKKLASRVVKAAKKYAVPIIGVVGVVLAPFTGGASLAAAAVITAGIQAAQAKKAAAAAKKMQKKEAAEMERDSQAQVAQANQQLNTFYQQNQKSFGITPDAWAKMTMEQKNSAIDMIGKGQWNVTTATAMQEQLIPGSTAAPGGQFTVKVEGQTVGTYATAEAASDAALEFSGTGQRFEIEIGGKVSGMGIRTTEGYSDVPPEMAEKVRAMSAEEVKSAVLKAEEAKKGGFPTWLLIPAAAIAAVAAGVI